MAEETPNLRRTERMRITEKDCNHPVGTACRRLPEWAKTRA